ncbi:MAG: ABC transporter ATP-binding protein, partial [Planctomycetes bacterium]|nr:ABC transporter ATP-binding protein [Planctomycetota bacterium]
MTNQLNKNIVQLNEICFAYGDHTVLDNVEFDLASDEVVGLVGPSGCGKSTLLRLIADLEFPQAGSVLFEKNDQNHQLPLRYMFQDYDAFPWLTVAENVQKGSGVPPHPTLDEVSQLLDRVGLRASMDRFPAELSGGMRKRLALARTLIRRPKLLLLDEPFASLDPDTRLEMYQLLQELIQEASSSVILVTHDLNEAIFLSDRVLVGSHRPMKIQGELPVRLNRPRIPAMMDEPTFLGALHTLH